MQHRQMDKTWQSKAKRLMILKDITQDDIAEKLEKSKGTISNWFSGRHPVSLADLRELSKMLGISVAEMLSEDDSLAQNRRELDLLRTLRKLPEDQQEKASALLAAVLSALQESSPDQ